MDFGKVFSYEFEDADWIKKLILPGLIMLIPIVGQIYVLGWMVEIIKRVRTNHPEPLPDVDFGEYLGVGFKALVVQIVYSLLPFVFSIPIMIGGVISGAAEEEAIAIITSVCFGPLVLIAGLLAGGLTFAAMGILAEDGTIGAALDFKRAFKLLRAGIGSYLIVLLIAVIAMPLLSSLGALLCGLGVLFTAPYSMAVFGHALGQAYQDAVDKLPA